MTDQTAYVSDAPHLPKARLGYVDIADGQVHYRVSGVDTPGEPPLVCFHQSPNSSRTYREVLPYIGVKRRVYALDTPGFGESFRPSAKPTLPDYTRWLAQAVTALGHETFDVMGIFTGAGIAADMAMRYPDRVRRVILLAPPYFTEARPNTKPWPAPAVEDGSHLMEAWNKVIPSNFHSDLPFERRVESFYELWRGGSNAIWGEEAVTAYPLNETLPKVLQPTLVVHPDFVLADVDLAVKALPNAQVARLEGVRGHTMLQRSPARMADIFNTFLDS
jgi:pimeloyl-ACP methyl ester carboxylesterase